MPSKRLGGIFGGTFTSAPDYSQWNEFDLKHKEWRIPAQRMKMKEEHIIPLSDQAISILNELHPITGSRELVFPGANSPRKPMSENTLTFAIRKRLGFDATAHGFRATASTILNETGFRADVIERQLAHTERNKIRKDGIETYEPFGLN